MSVTIFVVAVTKISKKRDPYSGWLLPWFSSRFPRTISFFPLKSAFSKYKISGDLTGKISRDMTLVSGEMTFGRLDRLSAGRITFISLIFTYGKFSRLIRLHFSFVEEYFNSPNLSSWLCIHGNFWEKIGVTFCPENARFVFNFHYRDYIWFWAFATNPDVLVLVFIL